VRRRRIRHRLQRRLFRWFGLAIVASALVVLMALRFTSGNKTALALALLPVLGVVWGASGVIARRLARPAVELARVANELGAGNLAARTALGRCRPSGDDEFDVMHRAFDGMAERIEGQLRAQKELLAAVSHELRTPLSRIRLLVELGRDGAASSTTFDELEREVVEIDALVGDLLASSRLDFHALTKRSLDAADLGRRALDRAGLAASRLVVDGSAPIEGDEGLLLRALANLLRNAEEHGDGLVRLSVMRVDGVVQILAEDAGPGFSEDDPRVLFEPFAQAVPGSTNGTLGLGLALVKRIAEAHGGRVVAESATPRGARVGFELPFHDDDRGERGPDGTTDHFA